MALVKAADARTEWNDRFKSVTGQSATDADFQRESKRVGYQGGDVDRGQMDAYFADAEKQYGASRPKTGGVETVPSPGGGGGPAYGGLMSAFTGGGGGGGGGAMQMPIPMPMQGEPSPTNPELGHRNLPMQGLKLALMRGRIY